MGWSRRLAPVSTRKACSVLVVVAGILGACRGTPPAIGPVGMRPVSDATLESWLRDVSPSEFLRYDLRWRYQTQQGRSAGRAAVRFAPPDSVRFDFRAPFGRSGAAMLVADTVLWSTSDEDNDRFLSVSALFWAALAIPRPPPPSAKLYGLDAERIRSWRYVTGSDTLTYVVTKPPARGMQAELRQAGRIIGLVEVTFNGESGDPEAATMRFPTDASIVTFEVQDVERLDALDPAIWKRP